MYCSIVWSGTRESNLNQLILLQKKAVRHISNAEPRNHTSPLYKDLHLLKLKDLFHVNIAIFAYKAQNGLLPNAFTNFLTNNVDIHNHYTRHSRNVHQYSVNSSIGMLSIQNRTIKTDVINSTI